MILVLHLLLNATGWALHLMLLFLERLQAADQADFVTAFQLDRESSIEETHFLLALTASRRVDFDFFEGLGHDYNIITIR